MLSPVSAVNPYSPARALKGSFLQRGFGFVAEVLVPSYPGGEHI